MADSAPQRVFSGVQPTGIPHLGNLLGAFRHWVTQQDTRECLYCVVDLHAITVHRDPDELRSASIEMATALMAIGIDPGKAILFVQSAVREHTELAWILNCVATFGEVRRMTQFKEKSGGEQESVSVGLFDYPVLQAADVLLYNAHKVPVGDDQRQHLELMRDIAIRFNGRYGDTFVVPESEIPPVGARIMDLQEPTKKMSKTGGTELGTIWLNDPPARIKKKIMGAVTDSGSEVRASPDKPGVTALLELMAGVTQSPVADLEERFAGMQYGAFKKDVLETLQAYLEPIQERHAELAADPGEVMRQLGASADRAREIAVTTMEGVRRRVGFLGA